MQLHPTVPVPCPSTLWFILFLMFIWRHFCSRMWSLDVGPADLDCLVLKIKAPKSVETTASSLSATQLHIPSVACFRNAAISPVHCYCYRSAITSSCFSALHCCYAYKLTVIILCGGSPHLHTTSSFWTIFSHLTWYIAKDFFDRFTVLYGTTVVLYR